MQIFHNCLNNEAKKTCKRKSRISCSKHNILKMKFRQNWNVGGHTFSLTRDVRFSACDYQHWEFALHTITTQPNTRISHIIFFFETRDTNWFIQSKSYPAIIIGKQTNKTRKGTVIGRRDQQILHLVWPKRIMVEESVRRLIVFSSFFHMWTLSPYTTSAANTTSTPSARIRFSSASCTLRTPHSTYT